MKGFSAALWTESLKAWRSIILRITVVIFTFMAGMMGLLVFLAKHPELVSNSVVLSTKTSMLGKADWPTYFILLYQIVAMVGLIGFGFVFSWIYGREYSDRTVKDLLALPVTRSAIVVAKLSVATVWCILLSVILFVVGIAAGKLVNMDGWSIALAWQACGIFSGTALMTIVLCTPVAFFASYGRGFLVPIGYLISIMIITQFAVSAIPVIAPYFPWAIPALYSGAAGPDAAQLGAISYIILFFTGVLGLAGTLLWWRYADQK